MKKSIKKKLLHVLSSCKEINNLSEELIRLIDSGFSQIPSSRAKPGEDLKSTFKEKIENGMPFKNLISLLEPHFATNSGSKQKFIEGFNAKLKKSTEKTRIAALWNNIDYEEPV